MKTPKLVNVTNVVALSYLVLIPVAGVLMLQRVKAIDTDLTVIWDEVGLKNEDLVPRPSLRDHVRNWLGRN